MPEVQIPSKAVSDGTDVREPVRHLLEDLNLLASPSDMKKADGLAAVVSGPPQSVALIEAGATAAAKWWAAGLSATALATWGTVYAWWGAQEPTIKLGVVVGAALVTAAIVVSIGYLLAADVRGRAAASVATIEARAGLAERMIVAAGDVYDPADTQASVQLVPLPAAVRAKNHERPAGDEDGWLAVAMERHHDGAHQYVLVKGSSEATVPASKLEFV
jgi:hypothetical protein